MRILFFLCTSLLCGSLQAQVVLPARPVSIANRSLTVAVSPDTRKMVAYDRSADISLWDAETGRFLADLTNPSAYTSSVRFLNERELLVTAEDSTVYILDSETGEPSARFKASSSVWQATATADGQRVAAWGMSDLVLFERASGKVLLRFGADFLFGAALSADGRYLAFATSDSLYLHRAADGKRLVAVEGRFSMVQPVFSPDGKQLFTHNYSEGALYEVPSGRLLHTLEGHEGSINHAVFDPSSRLLATCSDDSTVRLWNPDSGELSGILGGHSGEVNHAHFSTDGSRVVTTALDKTAVNQRAVIIWDTRKQQRVLAIPLQRWPINTATFSQDGSRVILDFLHSVPPHIYDAHSGQLLAALKNDATIITAAAFGREGSLLYSISDDKVCRVWDVENRTVRSTDLKTFYREVYTGFYSPDFSKVLVPRPLGGVEIWDTLSRKKIFSLDSAGHPTTGQFSPDGRLVVTASLFHDGGEVFGDAPPKVWDAQSGHLVRELRGHRLGVSRAVFSSDGRYVVTASDDSTARVWDSQTGSMRTSLKHPGKVTVAALGAGNRYLVAATDEGVVHTWEVDSARLMHAIKFGKESIKSVAISPDGKWVLVLEKRGAMTIVEMAGGKKHSQLLVQGGEGQFSQLKGD